MSKFWLCELGSLKIIELKESEENLDGQVMCASGASNEQRYFALPEGVQASNCKLQCDSEVYSLVEDTGKEDNPLWIALRTERDVKLIACDWTQLADSPLTVEQKAAWATYRQDLRDIPQDFASVEVVEWPTQPE